MSTLRCVSLVHNLCLKDMKVETSRNLCLYDVDNDGVSLSALCHVIKQDIELVVGCSNVDILRENSNIDTQHNFGSLYVIKHGELWRVALQMEMIFHPLESPDVKTAEREAVTPLPLKKVHCQPLAYNAKDICLFSSGGVCDIVVAHSDRAVRLYTWSSARPHSTVTTGPGDFVILIKWELAGQLIASQPGGGFAVLQRKYEKYGDKLAPTLVYYPPGESGPKNTEARTWLVGNVRSSQPNSSADSWSSTLCSGDGVPKAAPATSARILALCRADGNLQLIELCGTDIAEGHRDQQRHGKPEDKPDSHTLILSPTACTTDPPSQTPDRETSRQTSSLVGTVGSKARSSHLLWSFNVNVYGELFGLTKADIMITAFLLRLDLPVIAQNSNEDVLCACAWDGTTYVFNPRGQLLRLPLGRSCQAFTAGRFARTAGNNEPVLVHVTCDDQVLIHYDLPISGLGLPPSLPLCSAPDESAQELVELPGGYVAACAQLLARFEELGVDVNDQSAVRRTIRYLLYEMPKESRQVMQQRLSKT